MGVIIPNKFELCKRDLQFFQSENSNSRRKIRVSRPFHGLKWRFDAFIPSYFTKNIRKSTTNPRFLHRPRQNPGTSVRDLRTVNFLFAFQVHTSAIHAYTPPPTQCAAAKRLRAEPKALVPPALRAEDARSASAGSGLCPEVVIWRNITSHPHPSPKAACGIVAAAASRPLSGERNAPHPQPRVQGRNPGQEGGEGVQRVEG